MRRGLLQLRLQTTIICLLLLKTMVAPVMAQNTIHGTVNAGQVFSKRIASNLVFVLAPVPSVNPGEGDGWNIKIEPAHSQLDGTQPDDYTRCLTEPAHGRGPTEIAPGDFVNERNQRLPDSELSKRKKRVFDFVLNSRDQAKACEELDNALYGKQTDNQSADMATAKGARKSERPFGHGELVITAFELADTGPGKRARLKSLTFDLRLGYSPQINSK